MKDCFLSSSRMLLLVIPAVVALSLLFISPLSPLDTEEITPVTSSQTGNSTPSDTLEPGSDGGESESRNALQNGLQAYYRFDSPEVSRGNSLEFDGSDDFVEVSEEGTTALDVDNLTFMAWVKTTGESTGNMVMNKERTYELAAGSHGISMAVQADGCSGWCSGWGINDAGNISDQWTHVAGTWNGTTMTVYKNGKEVDSRYFSDAGPIDDTDRNLGIGARDVDQTPSSHFEGVIDDVQIYNYSLSKSELEDVYKENSVSSEGLILQQDFDEGPDSCDLTSGNTCLEDESGNGNDGTPENFTNNSFNTGSGWFNETPLNRLSLKDYSSHDNLARFYGGNNGELKNFDFNDSSGWTDGIEGESALKFDGHGDYVRVNSSNELEITREITVSVWVYPESSGWRRILMKGEHDEYILDLSDDREFRFRVYDENGDHFSAYSSQIDLDRWYHVVGVYDGAETKIYVNNTRNRGDDLTSDLHSTSYYMAIGSSTDYKDSWAENSWDGRLGGVRLFKTGLSASEVESLYNGERVHEGLVGEWGFEEGDGEKAYDTSSRSTEGVLGTESLVFDGEEDYVDSGVESLPTNGTVSAWYKTNSSERSAVLGVRDEDIFRFNLNYEPGQAGTTPGILGVNVDYGTLTGYVDLGPVIYDGNWHHYALSWNGVDEELNISFDGEPHSVTYLHKNNWSGTKISSLAVGEETSGANFNGQVDEVRVYNRSLSQQEIKQLSFQR